MLKTNLERKNKIIYERRFKIRMNFKNSNCSWQTNILKGLTHMVPKLHSGNVLPSIFKLLIKKKCHA